jgi:hypothetical protein
VDAILALLEMIKDAPVLLSSVLSPYRLFEGVDFACWHLAPFANNILEPIFELENTPIALFNEVVCVLPDFIDYSVITIAVVATGFSVV